MDNDGLYMVKKILGNGQACEKCLTIEKRLWDQRLWSRLTVILADERDPESGGMHLARRYHIDHAPFFIVREASNDTVRTDTSYLKFFREVLYKTPEPKRAAQTLLEEQQHLDLL